jgi:GR25 family glycosyltransferase involved in LPS biosynthesis
MIPKNIFQSWISRDLHPEIQKKVDEMKSLNSEYTYQLYTDSEIDKFVNTFYPGEVSECFNRLNVPVAKVDFWRYLILYKYGGIYVDLDSSINISLNQLIDQNDTAIITAETNPNTFVQWALIFDKQHPILKKVIELIIENIQNNSYPNDILRMTGPQVYSKAILSLHYDLFGENLNFSRIINSTDITFSKNSISYRVYGIDYNNKFTFKFPESEYLYIEKESWRTELLKKELLHPKLNVDQIYICHYKKLKERKESLLDQFREEKIYRYEFVENFDKTEWNINEIEKEYPKVFKEWKKGLESYDENSQNSERSLALKHAFILKDIFKKQYQATLILEDDVILCDDFVNYCNLFMSQLPDNWDIVWVGSCLNLHEPSVESQYVYKTDRGSRCTHAFLVSKSMVNKVIDCVSDINLPSDHFYNYLIEKFKLNNYWFEPSLANQSLEYKSEISGNYWNEFIVG